MYAEVASRSPELAEAASTDGQKPYAAARTRHA
jgi:hypothetical protein